VLETDATVLPSGRRVCSFTDPPPNVATTSTAYFPPFKLNSAVVALILENLTA